MSDIQIGLSKSARRTFALDDVALVPTRRTRDRRDVDTSWQIDAFRFDTPIVGAPMDSVMSPKTAIALGQLGGLGVLNLEGLWTRYEDRSRCWTRLLSSLRPTRHHLPGVCSRSTPSRLSLS